eukprot:11166027-Lingulodinium_polyedra.AAC.1
MALARNAQPRRTCQNHSCPVRSKALYWSAKMTAKQLPKINGTSPGTELREAVNGGAHHGPPEVS